MSGSGESRHLAEELTDPGKKLTTDASGEEAVIANVAEVAVGDMRDQTSEELEDGEGHGRQGVGVVVEIFERDGDAIVSFDAGFAEGRAFEIFAEIFDGGLAVIGLFIEMDNPGFVVKDIEPGVESGVGFKVSEFFG